MPQAFRWFLVLGALIAAIVVGFRGHQQPVPAFAADCAPESTGTLIIEIFDVGTNAKLVADGTLVLIKPDPRDFVLDQLVADTSLQDASSSTDQDQDAGVIRYEDACATEGGETYTVSVWSLPPGLDECTTVTVSDSTALSAGDTQELLLEVDCTGVGPTPTPSPQATVGPASAVSVLFSPVTVGCSGTSVVTVQVRDAQGQPVPAGITVTLSSSLGTVSPSSGILTSSTGNAFAFFNAPATTGGVASVTATADSLSGTGTISVNCGDGTTATVAPPPTLGSGSVSGQITPPNTGDGGLASRSGVPARLFLALTLPVLGVWALLARPKAA